MNLLICFSLLTHLSQAINNSLVPTAVGKCKISIEKNKLFTHLPLILGMALMMPSANASAQGTVEDYNRAYAVSRHFQADSVYNWARYMAWCDSSHVFHYQISTPQE